MGLRREQVQASKLPEQDASQEHGLSPNALLLTLMGLSSIARRREELSLLSDSDSTSALSTQLRSVPSLGNGQPSQFAIGGSIRLPQGLVQSSESRLPSLLQRTAGANDFSAEAILTQACSLPLGDAAEQPTDNGTSDGEGSNSDALLARVDIADADGTATSQRQATKVLYRPIRLIAQGETLVSIAQQLFNDASLGWLIFDLNRQNVSESIVEGKTVVEIHSRQRLELPVAEDIASFYQKREKPDPDNLITVVLERQIDKSVIDNLKPILAACSSGSSLALQTGR
jgi:hypothetical protein